jgi:protein-S-isoprenylcysteine O-methyltransferase Ste14
MRASAIEFRLRMAINTVIIVLGFWAPWIEWLGIGRRISLVEWLALEIRRSEQMSFAVVTTAVIAVAVLFALASIVFRVWGTAYLGPGTVTSARMVAGKVLAAGPYRFVRNPLYIGVWCMVAAMAFLMPVSGALFAVVLITIFLIRLTLGEESFLSAKLGEPYHAYLRAVPRFIPRLRGAPAPAGEKPEWLRALLAEISPIGVLAAIVVYSRDYDLALALRTILIFFGASLVVRALMPRPEVNSAPAK